eukprot:jgi/Chlat1/500/Chrsp103S01098
MWRIPRCHCGSATSASLTTPTAVTPATVATSVHSCIAVHAAGDKAADDQDKEVERDEDGRGGRQEESLVGVLGEERWWRVGVTGMERREPTKGPHGDPLLAEQLPPLRTSGGGQGAGKGGRSANADEAAGAQQQRGQEDRMFNPQPVQSPSGRILFGQESESRYVETMGDYVERARAQAMGGAEDESILQERGKPGY